MVKTEETHIRSVIKSLSWRTLASISTLVLSYVLTGNLVFAGIISITDTVIKLIEYFLHERVWSYIPWCYRREPNSLSSANHNESLALS